MSATLWNLRLTYETHHQAHPGNQRGRKLLGHTELSTTGVEKLIRILATLRSKMAPEVDKAIPTSAPPGGPANLIYRKARLRVIFGSKITRHRCPAPWRRRSARRSSPLPLARIYTRSANA
jgi:hypothetical protein